MIIYLGVHGNRVKVARGTKASEISMLDFFVIGFFVIRRKDRMHQVNALKPLLLLLNITVSLIAIEPGKVSKANSTHESSEVANKYDNWLGFSPAVSEGKIYAGLIYPESPADKSELKTGDQILYIDEHRVSSQKDFWFIINNLPPGTTVALKYRRGTRTHISNIQILRKEEIASSLNRHVFKLNLEGHADGRAYQLNLPQSKVKVLYFFNMREQLKDNISSLVKKLAADANKDDLLVYGITRYWCKSVRRSVQAKSSQTYDCEAHKFTDAKLPFEIYYDSIDNLFMRYRIERTPAIIVIDKNNIIRAADYVDETNIEKSIETIKDLMRQVGNTKKK